ncbi:peptidoglycan editing factor PgeF [Agarivorans sp. MS3-6]
MAIHSVNWPCPDNVTAIYSDRLGGVSLPPFDSYNLGDHVGDCELAVQANRLAFQQHMPTKVCWLKQVHSTKVVDATRCAGQQIEADGSYTSRPEAACVVMTADCLPILLCDQQGTVVSAVHAGWRGLVNGVVENAVAKMNRDPATLMAWMGPAIGPSAFEVGQEVKREFEKHDPQAQLAFKPSFHPNKYLADIFALAELRFKRVGLTEIYSDRQCTFTSPQQFYSYRREATTGRMAAAIWLG